MTYVGSRPANKPVTVNDIEDDAITSAKIATGTIVASDLGANSVDSSELVDGSVDISHLSATGTKSSSTFLAGDNSFKTVTGTTINTNADNRVITGSGTANTLTGEANLTYDGTTFQVSNSSATSDMANIKTTADGIVALGLEKSDYKMQLGLDFANDGSKNFFIRQRKVDSSTVANAQLIINQAGSLILPQANQGIYLGVTSASASHLLDDYEEGTWTPAWSVQGGGSLGTAPSTNAGVYTKVGRMCTISIMSYVLATSGTISSYTCTNLPFQSAPFSVAPAMGQEFGQTGYGMLCVNAQDDSTVVIKKYDGNGPPANAYMRVQFTYQTV